MKNNIVLAIATGFALPLSQAVFGNSLPEYVRCANSPDGKPVVINSVLKCDLQTSFDDEGKLAKRTFGIVRRIDFSSDIRLDVNPQTVMIILEEDTITFPTQPLSAAIVMGTSKGKERVLPISMNINPVFTKTGEICDLKFVEFEPNISKLSSPNLPKWISKGAEKFLNNNRRLKNKMLKLANDAALKIRAKICGQ